jgi:DNA uptake protein ComE-like DNA-binding protein
MEARKDSAVEILNSAPREALIAVHGIGEVLADRIIGNRPYQEAYEVVDKGILPESTYIQLRRELLEKTA